MDKLESRTMFAKNIILRLALGGMLLLFAVAKFKTGIGEFSTNVSGMFAESIFPMGLVKGFLSVVPLVELVLGALILLGLYTRYAALLAALLFALFIIGLSATGANDFIMLASNYIHIFACFLLAEYAPHSTWSLDHAMCKGGSCKI